MQRLFDNGEFIRKLIGEGVVNAVHDVSDGGIACAAAEMALAGGVGVSFCAPEPGEDSELTQLFGERPASYLIAVSDDQLEQWDSEGFLPYVLGKFEGDSISIDTGVSPNVVNHTITLEALRDAHEGWMPRYMAGE